MSNSGFIAAMGSVAAAIFFVAAVICGAPAERTDTSRVLFIIALALSGTYLFVSLFWGVRATSLESFQVKREKDQQG